jgi:hypothetical protein
MHVVHASCGVFVSTSPGNALHMLRVEVACSCVRHGAMLSLVNHRHWRRTCCAVLLCHRVTVRNLLVLVLKGAAFA